MTRINSKTLRELCNQLGLTPAAALKRIEHLNRKTTYEKGSPRRLVERRWEYVTAIC